MAISTNLAVINDNLTGYDPVEGETEGTTIGRNYIMWQVYKGLEAFNSNVIMISSSGATPDWLVNDSGSMMVAPAKSAATTNQRIKFFMLNDLGLSGSIPSAFIYEWSTTTDATSTNNNLFNVSIKHRISGSTLYQPTTSGSIIANDNGSGGAVANCAVALYTNVGTTTVMKDIPKIIYWKSSTSNAVISISKYDATYRGYLMWHTPTFTGYRASLSGSFTQGENFNSVVFNNGAGGATWIEPFTQTYESNLATIGSYLNPLSSAGLMPSTQFVISGSLTLLTGKLKFGIVDYTTFKAVCDYLEGVELANSTAHNYAAGTIAKFNSKYYMSLNTISDGAVSHKILIKLED